MTDNEQNIVNTELTDDLSAKSNIIPESVQQFVLDRIKYSEEHPNTMIDWEKAKQMF